MVTNKKSKQPLHGLGLLKKKLKSDTAMVKS